MNDAEKMDPTPVTTHIEECEEKIKRLVCSWSNKYEPDLRAALEELVGDVQEDDAFWHQNAVPLMLKEEAAKQRILAEDAILLLRRLRRHLPEEQWARVEDFLRRRAPPARVIRVLGTTEQTKPPSGGAATGQTEDKATEPVAPLTTWQPKAPPAGSVGTTAKAYPPYRPSLDPEGL